MKVHAVCLLFLIALQRCNGSTLRASSVNNDKEDQRERELQSVTNTNLYSSVSQVESARPLCNIVSYL